METIYKCTQCGRQTFGVITKSPCSGNGLICPHCNKSGLVINLTEQSSPNITNIGGGFFKKKS